jgi:hypothetical protein
MGQQFCRDGQRRRPTCRRPSSRACRCACADRRSARLGSGSRQACWLAGTPLRLRACARACPVVVNPVIVNQSHAPPPTQTARADQTHPTAAKNPAPPQLTRLRHTAALLRRRAWYVAGTAHHSGSRSAHRSGSRPVLSPTAVRVSRSPHPQPAGRAAAGWPGRRRPPSSSAGSGSSQGIVPHMNSAPCPRPWRLNIS